MQPTEELLWCDSGLPNGSDRDGPRLSAHDESALAGCHSLGNAHIDLMGIGIQELQRVFGARCIPHTNCRRRVAAAEVRPKDGHDRAGASA